MHMAFARHLERRIIDAMKDAAYTGKAGTATTAFDTANQEIAKNYVAAGASPADKNLTKSKLIKVRSIFGQNEVAGQGLAGGGEKIYMAISQAQIDALLEVTEVTSRDYRALEALSTGELNEWLGITFIRTEQLPKTGNVRECYAWVKSGVKFTQSTQDVRMDPLPERQYALQIYVDCRDGGVRTEEKKVVRVLCDETKAAA